MAGLSNLREIYEKRGKSFLENLLNKTVIINERLDGAYFGVKRETQGSGFNYFKKDSKLGYADRVLSRYYEPAISHFDKLSASISESIPSEFVFGMEYFPGKQNPLVLTHIKVLDENYEVSRIIHDKEILNEWSSKLMVNPPSIIFQGKLSDDQKIKIQEFVFTPISELSEKFKTISFTKHILSVLNPSLYESSEFDEREINEIVFRFAESEESDEDRIVLAKMVDPVFQERAKDLKSQGPKRKSDDYVWIIVIDLMNFIESIRTPELKSLTLTGNTQDELYVSLLNRIFVEFIKEYGDKFEDLEIQIPEFLKRPEFDVNLDLVSDDEVIESIKRNPNFKEIYRIFINIFRKRKLKIGSPLFTSSMKSNLEDQINRLHEVAQSNSVYENYFPSFNEFIGDDSEPGYFETYDTENSNESKVKRVNLLLSEFQPIHNGHIKSAAKLTEKNGFPTLFVCIHPGKNGKAFPFKEETIKNSLGKIVGSNQNAFAGPIMIHNGNIETILKSIKPEYEPVSIAADSSRINDIALQLELAKKRTRNLNIKRDTKLIELEPVSISEKIIDSIKNRDFLRYKEWTPTEVHAEFYNLNRDLMESLTESKQIEEDSPEDPIETSVVEPIIIIED